MNFFDPNYKIPNQQDQFLKFKAGINKFRFIGKPITGYELFTQVDDKAIKLTKRDNEPFTKEELDSLPNPKVGEKKPKFFMTCCVYDYTTDNFKILSITQKGILESIKDCVCNPDYGNDVSQYDFTVTKKGEGMETEYSTLPSPPKSLPQKIADRIKLLEYDLSKMFQNEYPAESYPFEKMVK